MFCTLLLVGVYTEKKCMYVCIYVCVWTYSTSRAYSWRSGRIALITMTCNNLNRSGGSAPPEPALIHLVGMISSGAWTLTFNQSFIKVENNMQLK